MIINLLTSDSRVTNIYQSFTYKMAAKTSWHRDMERNYVAVTACSDGVRRMQGRTPRWARRVSTACQYQYQYQYQCQYRVPGVNSDSLQMDVFRILRVAFLKSTSTGATTLAPDYLPIGYEIFGARSDPAAPPRWPRTAFPSATRSSALDRTRRRHHAGPGLPSHRLRDLRRSVGPGSPPRWPRTAFPSATRSSALGRAGLATRQIGCETRSPKSRPTCAPAVICSIYS